MTIPYTPAMNAERARQAAKYYGGGVSYDNAVQRSVAAAGRAVRSDTYEVMTRTNTGRYFASDKGVLNAAEAIGRSARTRQIQSRGLYG